MYCIMKGVGSQCTQRFYSPFISKRASWNI